MRDPVTTIATTQPELDEVDELFCGCCGNGIGRSTRSDPDWCRRCKPHVRTYPASLPPWERTYYAQHKRDCPYQVGGVQ